MELVSRRDEFQPNHFFIKIICQIKKKKKERKKRKKEKKKKRAIFQWNSSQPNYYFF